MPIRLTLLTLFVCTLTTAQEAKHVILFIADGNQLAHEIVASHYASGQPNQLRAHAFPYQSFATTWDVATYNAHAKLFDAAAYQAEQFDPAFGYAVSQAGAVPYPREPSSLAREHYFIFAATDSASSATCLATGVKTDKGNISWQPGDPTDGAITTIAEHARDAGLGMGVVSTVQFSHATPAAFVSHNVRRNNYGEIAHEIIREVQPDVVIGAGHPNPDADDHADWTFCPKADYQALKDGSTDYIFVEADGQPTASTRLMAGAAQAMQQNKKLFGLFGSNQKANKAGSARAHPRPGPNGFRWDRRNPDLATATAAALQVLTTKAAGSFLMVEAGDIDWANHGDDTAWMIGAWKNLDDAVRSTIADIESGRHPGMTPGNTLVIVTADHGNGLMRIRPDYNLDTGIMPRSRQVRLGDGSTTQWPDNTDIAYPNYPDGKRFASHTNELVTVYAWGAGTDELRQREGEWYPETPLLDHHQIHAAMMAFLGLE